MKDFVTTKPDPANYMLKYTNQHNIEDKGLTKVKDKQVLFQVKLLMKDFNKAEVSYIEHREYCL